jgi:formylglycine-generating enzyme required for sulfatase activity
MMSLVAYAQALTTLEKGRRSPALAMAATGGRSAGTTLGRVRRILGVSNRDCGQANFWVGGIIALVLLASLAVVLPLGHAQEEPNAGQSPPKMASADQPAAPSLAKPGDPPQDVSKKSTPAAIEVEARRRETRSESWGFRHRRTFLADGGQINMVGLLVTNGWWRESLPLAPAQASAITKLDGLVQETIDDASLAAADYMDTNPPDYKEYVARFNKRHYHETFRHAERMVALGLLTEPQAALVSQRYLTGSSPLNVLRDENVQDLFRITESQKKEFDKVGDEANRREARLNLWSTDQAEQEKVRDQMAANRKQMDAAAMKVLTPSQQEMWSRLTAERHLPAKPPDLLAPSEAEAARIKLEDVSPVFRVLTDRADALKFSDPQKKFLKRLEEIVRDGLFWISLRNAKEAAPVANAGQVPVDRVSAARAEFIKEAEQVALFGILTEKQAEQVESAIKPKQEFKTSLGSILLYCPPGAFMMGSPANDKDLKNGAQVSVTISKGFYLGKYSVTQAEFKSVMGAMPWAGKEYVKPGDDYPATYVDWDDAAEFCRRLTARESQAGRLPQGYVYALPTEAQREYACRAGTMTAYSFGDDAMPLGEYAWYGANAGDTREKFAHRVGQRKPNPWGFYDLHGNVFEWCRDKCSEKLPGGTDPFVEAGAGRVNRGGCWGCNAVGCRSAFRNWDVPSDREDQLGFRLALVPIL